MSLLGNTKSFTLVAIGAGVAVSISASVMFTRYILKATLAHLTRVITDEVRSQTEKQPIVKEDKTQAKLLARSIARELAKGSGEADEEGKAYDDLEDGTHLIRNKTKLESEIFMRRESVQALVDKISEGPIDGYQMYIPNLLKDALFVGHLVTDLDSIAGAIGAADLYGGFPCRASELNSETMFAVEHWGVEIPRTIEEMVEEHRDAGICLVDHQQTSQVNPSVPVDRIVGVIDHHALQSETIVTAKPIYLDIRPWGSMSTIVAHTYFAVNRRLSPSFTRAGKLPCDLLPRPSKKIAGMLLCAILSDTLNLNGPTTTEWDKMIVALLTRIADVPDINFLATQQFKAKSRELAFLSPYQLICGDQKVFSLKGSHFDGKVGFAVVETTDDDAIMSKKQELLPELSLVKVERKLDLLFMAVVNIVEMRSHLFMVDEGEKKLAAMAFGGETSDNGAIMDLGHRVSRKKEFIPPITTSMETFEPPKSEPRRMVLPELYVDPTDSANMIRRRPSMVSPFVLLHSKHPA